MKKILGMIVALVASPALADLPDMTCIESQDSWTRIKNYTLQPTYFDNPTRVRLLTGYVIADGFMTGKYHDGYEMKVGPVSRVPKRDRMYSVANKLIQFDDDGLTDSTWVSMSEEDTEVSRMRCVHD